jgi:hypothetical protein
VGLEFIDRVRRTSVATAVVVALVAWARFGPAVSAAFLAGCAWSLVNIHVLRVLVRLVVGDPARSKLRIAAVLIIKIPVLYGAGYFFIQCGWLPIAGLLAGFGWPLAVVVLKAAGRLILGLDRSGRTIESAGHGATTVGSAGTAATRKGV